MFFIFWGVIRFTGRLFSISARFRCHVPRKIRVSKVTKRHIMFLRSFVVLGSRTCNNRLFTSLKMLKVFFRRLLRTRTYILRRTRLRTMITCFRPNVYFKNVTRDWYPLYANRIRVILFRVSTSLRRMKLYVLKNRLFYRSTGPVNFFQITLTKDTRYFI